MLGPVNHGKPLVKEEWLRESKAVQVVVSGASENASEVMTRVRGNWKSESDAENEGITDGEGCKRNS